MKLQNLLSAVFSATILLSTQAHPITVEASAHITQNCPVPAGTPTLADAPTIADLGDAILAYLSAGGSTGTLASTLIDRRLAQAYTREGSTPLNPPFANRGGVRTADFNGDGYLDVAVSTFDPADGYSGGLFVYICNGQSYRHIISPLAYAIDPDTGESKLEYIDRAPKFIYAGDMNSDGRAELVFDIGIDGASTIWEDVQIVGWNEQTQDMRPLKVDQESYPADAGYYKIVNASNRLKALVMRTGFSGSGIASGPQRQFTLTYAWNGKQFAEVSEVGDPSLDRLHVSYDALAALNHRNFKTAALLYNAALYNNHLDDDKDYDGLLQIVKTHAAYGLLLIAAQEYGLKSPQAAIAYQKLQKTAEGFDWGGFGWSKYGKVFWQAAQTTQNLHLGCEAVNEAISADRGNFPPFQVYKLGIWPWFTYNINWIPTDRSLSFCPL